MYPIQSEIYNTIAARTLDEIYNFRDRGRIQQFRKAKIIRMLQIASNPTLIYENAKEFSLSGKEFGFGKEKISSTSVKDLDSEIYEKIKGYSTCGEIPAKLVQTAKLTKELLKNGSAYKCYCSIEEIEEQKKRAKQKKLPFTYNR